MGGLHIEMALEAAIGKFLDNSWCLAYAAIKTAGNLNRSQRDISSQGHDMHMRFLFILSIYFYLSHMNVKKIQWTWKLSAIVVLAFPNLDIGTLLCIYDYYYLSSIREENSELYVTTLERIVPCFFVLNRTNCSRWLPVHIRDMKNLQL